MKKLLYFFIFMFVGAAVFHFSGQLSQKGGEVLETVGNIPALETIKEEISTPGALRARLDSKNASLTRLGTIKQTNRQRQENGLAPLKENIQLNQAALLKVKDMFEKQYFEHISPLGTGPADLVSKAGYQYISVGENLALGNYKDDKSLVEAWMNSPGHKANILSSKFSEIGVAVLKGEFEGKSTWLAVQAFAKPVDQCPRVDGTIKEKMDSLKAEIELIEPELAYLKSGLESMEPESQSEYDEYNKKVENYNNLVKAYNNKLDLLKAAIAEYNAQVSEFNRCLEQ